ncbi:MAG: ankyrin repeat domain-containing protein, partial [bacterium]
TRAVYKNMPRIIKLLVRRGAGINAYDANGDTALYKAAEKSHVKLIPLLVRLGADINQACEDGWDPINASVYNNDARMAEVLIKHGADVNLPGSDGYSPLTRAASRNLPQMVALLVKHGVDVNACDANEDTALSIAIRKSHTDLVSLLITLGADVNSNNDYGDFPLHAALKKNDQAAIQMLLEHQVDINAQDSEGNTVLHLAIERSYDDLVPLFAQQGVDAQIRNDKNISAALLAVFYGKKDLAKRLFKDCEPEVEDFLKTISRNDYKAFQMLLELSKTNPFSDHQNAIDIDFASLSCGTREFIDTCSANHPKFMSSYIGGFSPLHFATIYGHEKLVQFFVEHCNADINDIDCFGMTPLHHAAAYGNLEIAAYLITRQCFMNELSKYDFEYYKKGSTACDLAVQCGHTDMVHFLIKHGAKTNIVRRKNVVSDSSAYAVLFIDFEDERIKEKQQLASVKVAFSSELRQVIKQKVCPAIIIGQHLLCNALQLSCSLKDWYIVEIVWEGVEGYVIIPKRFFDVHSDFSSTALDSKLQNLGFACSSIKHSYVDESYVQNKKNARDSINFKDFSAAVPVMLDTLLMPRVRYMYWGGHGSVKSTPSIGCLQKDDALKLFRIFENKNTKMMYVSSCFFCGRNSTDIGNFRNMIVIAAATTEVAVKQNIGMVPPNWGGFFNALAVYNYDSDLHSACKYLADNVVPLIVTFDPDISNFPHIKFPGKPFTLLPVNNQAMLLNQEEMLKYQSNNVCVVENKRLLEIDMGYIKNPVEIRCEIPLISSNKKNVVFEKICISALEAMLFNDLKTIFTNLMQAPLFKDSMIENTFLIKELKLDVPILLDMKNNEKNLLQILYNVLIQRGPSDACCIFFSSSRNLVLSNTFCIVYDSQIAQWSSYTPLSTEEFAVYKEMLNIF